MSKQAKAGITIVVVAVFALIVYSTLNLSQFEVEVCVVWQGRQECRTAAGTTREEAQRTATSSACGLLTAGRAESMRCERSEPESVRWLKP